MLELNAKTTALVVIDLQEGILPFAGGPHTAEDVVNRAGKLAAKFRTNGQPVFLVRVGWSADYAEALKQPVDAPSPARTLPENWWQHPAALGVTGSDIEIIKRQWGAFYGRIWSCNYAVVALTPSSYVGSRPISVSNQLPAMPGSWALIW